ncbi:MAG: Rpn family recombination-promoting nuclease/putative transposase [Dysgonamonadaceae bacterium]|jgi:predicted transposase/invertase (TIGR01784 family)|nr:Rpn family recombination-promoting nuclease/putative transposase [Dysgonamonadaceae bacterium]
MAHYLDPRNDLTFKRVFGEHKHLCMSLLNSMLPLEKPVVGIEYQTGELLPEIEILRNSIVDVRCTDSDGQQFIVEMQMYWTESFKSRVLLNASKAYVMQLNRAERYELLQPVYALSFVNEIFEKSPEMQDVYYHHYKTVNIKNTQKQIKGLEFVFIELPKFRPQSHGEKKLHELRLRFLTEINERTREVPAELLENSYTQEAIRYMEISAYTKEQLFTYDKFRDGIMTERSVISDAWHKGEETGLQKGRKEGIKEAALNLLQMGISPEDIMQSTRLTEDEIRSLQTAKTSERKNCR